MSHGTTMDFELAALHYNRAIDLEGRGRYSEAVNAYQQAVALDPTDPETRIRLGMLLSELARHEEANLAFQAAMRLRYPGTAAPEGGHSKVC